MLGTPRILALLVLSGCAQPRDVPAQASVLEIPFEYSGHIFFHATINGDSARLLYDPVDGVMLDRNFALQRPGWNKSWRELGQVGPTRVGGGGGAQVEVTFADSVTLELGSLRQHFARVPVIPLDSMMGPAIAGRVDGLAGTTLFRDHAVRLDFAGRRLQLLDPATVDTTGWNVLPLTVVGAKGIVPVRITIADTVQYSMRAVIDLGMSPTFRVSTRETDARRLLRHGTRTMSTGRGLGGLLVSRRLGDVRVHLGSAATPPIEIELAREPSGADANPADYDALLGLGVLSLFDVIYDPGNNRMLVRAP